MDGVVKYCLGEKSLRQTHWHFSGFVLCHIYVPSPPAAFVQVHCFIAVNANHMSFVSNKCGFCRQRNNLQMEPLV